MIGRRVNVHWQLASWYIQVQYAIWQYIVRACLKVLMQFCTGPHIREVLYMFSRVLAKRVRLKKK